MKKLFILLVIPAFFAFNLKNKTSENKISQKIKPRTNLTMAIATEEIIKALTDKFGAENKAKIERGVTQVAALWTPADGDVAALKEFCITNYAKPGADQKALFDRLSTNFEVLFGHFNNE